MRPTKFFSFLHRLSICVFPVIGFFQFGAANSPNYLKYARIQVDTLLEHGMDTYGEVESGLWASVMDIDSLSVPAGGIDPTPGVRSHDRAMGGSNAYHELDTLKSMDLLSALTGKQTYTEAADRYIEATFDLTQNPETGLLGWGEHLYYNFHIDKIWIGSSEAEKPHYYTQGQFPHELMEWTPPWKRFSEVVQAGVQDAIRGLIYHFNGPDPRTYLFNRHAFWHKPERQTTIMPWIKHTALFAYSWALLHQQTGDEKYLGWSYDIGSLYHDRRHPDTGLVFGTLMHPKLGEGKTCGMGSAAYYAYWLYKTYQISGDTRIRRMALDVIDAYIKYGDQGGGQYLASMEIDGRPAEGGALASVWEEGYSAFTLPTLGRVLLYLAAHEPLADYGVRAASIFDYTLKEGIPERFNALQISDSIMFCLDLYTLYKKKAYLDRAKALADLAIKRLWRETMFSRQTGEAIYETKLGSSSLILALIRLHLALEGAEEILKETDWSF